LSYTTHGLESV